MMSAMQEQSAGSQVARNPFFVVFRGEDVAAAMARHYRDYGVGPLLLVRNDNAVSRPARSRRLRAA